MTVTGRFDPRLTAARGDLAAAKLRGRVEADAFVEGESFTVLTETLDMRRRPRPDAPLETQLLYGETLKVYDDEDGWGWAQADGDDYVGYVAMSALGRARPQPTHRVTVKRTFVYPAADMKQPPYAAVPLGGRVGAEGTRGDFTKIHGHGFVFSSHLARVDADAADFVSVAEQMLGTPYLWGGKSALGIDCSGLVQLATRMSGRTLPRDTDMQEAVGEPVAANDSLGDVRRGDLVFWKGHVGIMTDASSILHANAYHMLVSQEPLIDVRDRILSAGSGITSIRRLP